jgi:hypothetical protein
MAISVPGIIILLVIAAGLIVLIGAVTKNLRTPLLAGGIVSVTAAILVCGTFFLLQNQAIIIFGNATIESIFTTTVKVLGEDIYMAGGITALVGIIMIIISRLIPKKIA